MKINSPVGEEGAKMESEITQIELDRTDEEKETNKAIKSNKVEPESRETASRDPTTSVAITKTWRVFVGSSTLHGLQYVFTSRTLVRRILWALFLVAAIVWFSFQSSKLLRKYFSHPVTTKVSLVYEGSPEFPAVSICNFNRFKRSVIMAKGYDQLLNQYERKVFGLNTENYTVDFGEHHNFNFTEFDWLAGHQINDTLQGCVWSGTFCDYRNFTPVLTSMGLCHTFNSGRSASRNFLDQYSVRNCMNYINETFLYWLDGQAKVNIYSVLCFVYCQGKIVNETTKHRNGQNNVQVLLFIVVIVYSA